MANQIEQIDRVLAKSDRSKLTPLDPKTSGELVTNKDGSLDWTTVPKKDTNQIEQIDDLLGENRKSEFNVNLPQDVLPDLGGIHGGIGYDKKGSQENFGVSLNTSIPIGDNLRINPSATFESSSNQRQAGDGLILDESKQAIGAVIGGDFYLDDSGTNKLWAKISGGQDKLLNKLQTPGNTIVTEDGGRFTKWSGGVEVGKLGINIGDKNITYTLGNNGQFYINPNQVGVQFNIPLGGG